MIFERDDTSNYFLTAISLNLQTHEIFQFIQINFNFIIIYTIYIYIRI